VRTKRIGVMGGTFDPIHVGHLVAAEEARVRFALDRMVFVPCGQPPHKKDYSVTDREHRYTMTVLATSTNSAFEVSRIEIDRPGPSYTVDTLRELRGAQPQSSLYFVTGGDGILAVLTWRDPHELVQFCEFIAVTRPGYDLSHLEQALDPELMRHVHLLPIPGIDISSTEIRRRVAAGLPVKYLTPLEVEAYIAKQGLYRDDRSAGREGG